MLQKRPTIVSKETYYSVKRDILWCQKRPTTNDVLAPMQRGCFKSMSPSPLNVKKKKRGCFKSMSPSPLNVKKKNADASNQCLRLLCMYVYTYIIYTCIIYTYIIYTYNIYIYKYIYTYIYVYMYI